MMNRFKTALFFSLTCYILNVCLNATAFIVIELVPFLLHGEYSFYESQGGVFIFYTPLIFIITLIIGVKKVRFYLPLLYLMFSIYAMYPNSIDGYDVMFLFNFEFSLWSYVIYETIRKIGFLESSIVSLIIFNGIFFLYQIGLFSFSNKTFEKLERSPN